jgi:hypothetical protein
MTRTDETHDPARETIDEFIERVVPSTSEAAWIRVAAPGVPERREMAYPLSTAHLRPTARFLRVTATLGPARLQGYMPATAAGRRRTSLIVCCRRDAVDQQWAGLARHVASGAVPARAQVSGAGAGMALIVVRAAEPCWTVDAAYVPRRCTPPPGERAARRA